VQINEIDLIREKNMPLSFIELIFNIYITDNFYICLPDISMEATAGIKIVNNL